MILSLVVIFLALGLWLAQQWQERGLAELINSVELAAYSNNEEEPVELHSADLPPPVSRYLQHVLAGQQHKLRCVRFQQVGSLRTSTKSTRWMNFTASQIIAPMLTEFVWDARVVAAPLLSIRVRDSLLAGCGEGRVSLLSAIPVGRASGNMEMNSGALHRFLAEAVWYPTALLPSEKLRWDAIDERRALATLTEGSISVSLEFRFNERNEVEGIYTPGRWGSFDGGYKQVPWEGKFGQYIQYGGVLVPAKGEVGWYEEGEWQAVWRGEIKGSGSLISD